MNVQVISFKMASLISLGTAFMFPSDPQFYLLATAVVTGAVGLTLQLLRNGNEDRRREAEKRERLDHQVELKLEIERVALFTARTSREIKSDIQENTVITRDAMVASNHVNEKFDVLAKAAQVSITPLAKDTNAVVHRIENKVDSSSSV